MLEQAESLRTGGTSLTLFKNGWRVLDAIGVGNVLRTQFLELQGYFLVFLGADLLYLVHYTSVGMEIST